MMDGCTVKWGPTVGLGHISARADFFFPLPEIITPPYLQSWLVFIPR